VEVPTLPFDIPQSCGQACIGHIFSGTWRQPAILPLSHFYFVWFSHYETFSTSTFSMELRWSISYCFILCFLVYRGGSTWSQFLTPVSKKVSACTLLSTKIAIAFLETVSPDWKCDRTVYLFIVQWRVLREGLKCYLNVGYSVYSQLHSGFYSLQIILLIYSNY